MSAKTILDTSYLVALLDEKDVHHSAAQAIHRVFADRETIYIYLDCVINETATVLARRAKERKSDPLVALQTLRRRIPQDLIDWTGPEWPRLWDAVLDNMEDHRGRLSFTDSLITVAAKEAGIPWIASFDPGFDAIRSLRRIHKPEQIEESS